MELKNINKVKECISKFNNEDFRHYFIVEHPEWDEQSLYYNISYNVESDLMHHGYVEICSMIQDDTINECVNEIKSKFNLPVYKWKKVLVDYCK